MDADEFEKHGTNLVRYIADYMRTLHKRRVSPTVEPGYLRELLPKTAPRKGENFTDILADVEKTIMPGVSLKFSFSFQLSVISLTPVYLVVLSCTLSILCTLFFPIQWLLSCINTVKTITGKRRNCP